MRSRLLSAGLLGRARPRDRLLLYAAAIALLILARFVIAALLPLYYGDEPYYWLWSRYPAWGYFDHPPAVAVLIRAGTALFGDTEFGVRFFSVALAIPATLCVWRTGSLLLGDRESGACAALLFNATPMVAVQTMLATPDAPALACCAGFMWALAELVSSGNGRWWLAAGVFAGLGLLAKYTVLCLGGGAVLWLLLTQSGRAWLRTPWPWLGGAIAALLFAPNLAWNAEHDWGTLGFQLGRTMRRSARWWSLPQFVGEQIILATPFILFLALRGLWRATFSNDHRRLLLATLVWPSIVFFTAYAVQNRVHRNWPDVIYPGLAVAAAYAFRNRDGPAFVRAAAVPVAVAFVAVAVGQMLLRVVPLDRFDPLNQHLASRMDEVVAPVERALAATGAQAIVTTDWRMTSWLRFYLRAPVPVIQVTEEFRFPDAPQASAADLSGPLLHVTMHAWSVDVLRASFSEITPLPGGPRRGFVFHRLSGLKGEPLGRKP